MQDRFISKFGNVDWDSPEGRALEASINAKAHEADRYFAERQRFWDSPENAKGREDYYSWGKA